MLGRGTRLFTTRLELIATLDKQAEEESVAREQPGGLTELRTETAKLLRDEVAAMNLENFIVRPQRRLVEKYATPEAWTALTPEAVSELGKRIVGLPSQLETDDEEAKRFDLLMLNLQLAQLRSEPGSARLRDQVKAIAGLLGEKASIPIVAVVGDADDVVPYAENTKPFAEKYRAAGGTIEVIVKPGINHHPHSLKDPKPFVDFLLKHLK